MLVFDKMKFVDSNEELVLTAGQWHNSVLLMRIRVFLAAFLVLHRNGL